MSCALNNPVEVADLMWSGSLFQRLEPKLALELLPNPRDCNLCEGSKLEKAASYHHTTICLSNLKAESKIIPRFFFA